MSKGVYALLASAIFSLAGCGGGDAVVPAPPSGEPTAPVEPPAPPSEVPSDEAVLKARPLPPTDVNLFSPAAYPQAAPMAPAAGSAVMDAYPLIAAYFEKEDPLLRQRAVELYYNPVLMNRIPNPSLRAALTGLLGTSGEPAIDFYLNGTTDAGLPKVTAVGFDANPWDPTDTGIARTLVDPNTQQMSVFVNPKYQNENPFQFSSLLPHEGLHSDVQVAGSEEVIALALQSAVYLEQLSRHPELAGANTELTRRNNTNALARLNSGQGAALGLSASNQNRPILPESPLGFKSWLEQFRNVDLSQATPGTSLLRQLLGKMAGPDVPVPATPDFNQDTLAFIDRNSAALSQEKLVAAAKALKLNTQLPASSPPQFA